MHITYLLNIEMPLLGGRAQFYFLIKVLTEGAHSAFLSSIISGLLGHSW